MAGNIDERIVQMEFDNAQFERGVSTSINTIDKLKKALRFDDVSDGFNQITKSANKVDLSGIQNSLEKLQGMFTPMGLAFVKVWTDAVGKVEQKVASFNKAVFKDPFDDGFKEYELKMGSVQTIMNSSGESLDTVNEKLQELNEYADRTIYSFSDMTSNIGKFTNAGVSLNDAVKAIQGVSNVAALSGANANEASRAMYNFAQALSSGAVKLIDWKSIENANMATQEFKKELIESALELGTLVRVGDRFQSTTVSMQNKVSDVFDATMGFNDSLSSLWMTTDVLTKTLGKFSDETTDVGRRAFAAAQDVKTWSQLLDTLKEALGSGWAQSFEIIIGDFDEAKELFTMISNALGGVIDKTSKVRNSLLQLWRNNGGREKLLATITKMSDGLEKLYDNVLSGIFGNRNYQTLLEGINPVLEDTTKLVDKLTQSELDAAWDIWTKGLYGTGEERKRQLEEMGYSYERVQGVVDQIANGTWETKELTEATTEEVQQLQQYYEKNEHSVYGFIQRLKEIPELIFNTAKSAGTIISNIAEQLWSGFTAATNFFKLGDIIKRPFQGIADVFSDISANTEKASIFEEIGKRVGRVLNFIVDSLNEIFDTAEDLRYTIGEVLESSGADTLSNITTILSKLAQGFVYAVKAIAKFGTEFIKAFVTNINFKRITKDISNFSDSIRTIALRIYDSTKNSKALPKVLRTIMKVLDKILEIAGVLFVTAIDKLVHIIDVIKEAKERFDEWVSSIDESSRLYRAWEALKTIALNLWEAIKKIATSLSDALGGKTTQVLESSQTNLQKLYDIIKNIVDHFLDKFVDGLEALAKIDFANLDLTPVYNFFDNASGLIVTLYDKMEKGPEKFNTFFSYFKSDDKKPTLLEKIIDGMKNIFSNLPEDIEKAKTWGAAVGKGIVDGLSATDWGAILRAASMISFIRGVWLLGDSIKKLETVFDNFAGIGKTISTGINTLVDSFKTKITQSFVLSVVFLISALTAAMIALAYVPTDKLIIVTACLAILLSLLPNIIRMMARLYRQREKLVDAKATLEEKKNDLSKSIRNSISLGSFFIGLGVMLAGVAAVVTAIAKADDISKITSVMPWLLGMVGMILGFTTIIAYVISKMPQNAAENATSIFKSLGWMFVGIGVAIGIIVGSLVYLSKNDYSTDASNVIILLIGLFGAIAAFLTWTAKTSESALPRRLGSVIKAMAAAVSLLVLPLLAIAAIHKIFGDEGFYAATDVMFKLLILFGVMVGALAIINNFMANDTGTTKNLSYFLVSLSIALLAFAGSMAILQKSGVMEWFIDTLAGPKAGYLIGGIIGIIVVFLGSLAVMGAIFSKFSVAFVNGGKALEKLGIGFLAVSAGIFILTLAFAALPDALEGLAKSVEVVKAYGPEIFQALMTIGSFILAATVATVSKSKWTIALGIVSVLSSLGTMLEGRTGSIIKWMGGWIVGLVEAASAVINVVVDALVRLLILILAGLGIAIEQNGDELAEVIYIVFKTLFRIIERVVFELAWDLLEGLSLGFASIWNGVMDLFGAESKKINPDELMEGFDMFHDEVQDGINELGSYDMERLQDITKEVKDNMNETHKAFENLSTFDEADMYTKGWGDAFKTDAEDASDAVDILGNIRNDTAAQNWGKSLVQNLPDQLGAGASVLDITNVNLNELTGLDELAAQSGMDMSQIQAQAYSNGLVDENGQIMLDTSMDLQNMIGDDWTSNDMWEGLGEATDIQISDGVDDNDDEVIRAAEDLSEAINNTLNTNLVDNGYDIGYNYVSNIYKGAQDALDEAKANAANVAEGLGDRAGDISEVLQNDTMSNAVSSMGTAAEAIRKATNDSLKQSAAATNSAASYIKDIQKGENEVITTVMKVGTARTIGPSNINLKDRAEEQKRLQDAKYYQSKDYTDKWAAFGAVFSSEAAENASKGFSSGYIPSSTYFSAINTKIDDLDNKVSNMQIVMDTGALVGATSPAMNEALGTASSYSNYTSRSTITRR